MVYRTLGRRNLSSVRRMKMFTNHVSKQLSAYWNGELASSDTMRISEHPNGGTRCRSEFEELKLGTELTKEVTYIKSADSLRAGIETDARHHPEALASL